MFESCGGCCATLLLIPLLCCVLVVGAVIYIHSNAPDPPLSDNFKANQTEADQFQAELDRAVARARSQGVFDLFFNERQLSSWMALEGPGFAADYDHSFPFKNTQVALDDGEITFYGEFDRYQLTIPMEVVIKPRITRDRKLEFDITSADVGGVTMPDFVLSNITGQFNDVLIEPFNDLPGDYYIFEDSVFIQDGTFVLQGAVQP
jgi:hypothetical protein